MEGRPLNVSVSSASAAGRGHAVLRAAVATVQPSRPGMLPPACPGPAPPKAGPRAAHPLLLQSVLKSRCVGAHPPTGVVSRFSQTVAWCAPLGASTAAAAAVHNSAPVAGHRVLLTARASCCAPAALPVTPRAHSHAACRRRLVPCARVSLSPLKGCRDISHLLHQYQARCSVTGGCACPARRAACSEASF